MDELDQWRDDPYNWVSMDELIKLTTPLPPSWLELLPTDIFWFMRERDHLQFRDVMILRLVSKRLSKAMLPLIDNLNLLIQVTKDVSEDYVKFMSNINFKRVTICIPTQVVRRKDLMIPHCGSRFRTSASISIFETVSPQQDISIESATTAIEHIVCSNDTVFYNSTLPIWIDILKIMDTNHVIEKVTIVNSRLPSPTDFDPDSVIDIRLSAINYIASLQLVSIENLIHILLSKIPNIKRIKMVNITELKRKIEGLEFSNTSLLKDITAFCNKTKNTLTCFSIPDQCTNLQTLTLIDTSYTNLFSICFFNGFFMNLKKLTLNNAFQLYNVSPLFEVLPQSNIEILKVYKYSGYDRNALQSLFEMKHIRKIILTNIANNCSGTIDLNMDNIHKCTTLKTLKLHEFGDIDRLEPKHFCDLIKNSTLTTLSLISSCSKYNTASLEANAIISIFRNTSITDLTLCFLYIDYNINEMKEFAEAVNMNTTLRKLDIAYNKIYNFGLNIIFHNTSLTSLNLQFTSIDEITLLHQIQRNTTLKILYLDKKIFDGLVNVTKKSLGYNVSFSTRKCSHGLNCNKCVLSR